MALGAAEAIKQCSVLSSMLSSYAFNVNLSHKGLGETQLANSVTTLYSFILCLSGSKWAEPKQYAHKSL